MDKMLRETQQKVLRVFSKEAKQFALTGGTALELVYLHHRFSADLDFFSVQYDTQEIDHLIASFQRLTDHRIELVAELTKRGLAKMRFYSMQMTRKDRPLKLDFVQDEIVTEPKIRLWDGVRVYSAEDIFLQKISAVAGGQPSMDALGRPVFQGRNAARDVFDVYHLSKRIQPLHTFLRRVPLLWQKGLMHWYSTFSRREVKLGLLEMDIYGKRIDVREMIDHIEQEIKEFMREKAGEWP